MPETVTADSGRAARDAALGVAGVAGLHSGAFGEVALLLPGERINGIAPVRAPDSRELIGIAVHLIVDISVDRNIYSIAEEVRQKVSSATGFERIDITVADALDGPQLD